MRTRHATLLGLIVVIIAVSSASAYTLLGPARHWPGSSVNFKVNRGHISVTDGDQGVTRVVNALNDANVGWNSCSNNFVVNATSNPGSSWALGDGIPTVSLQSEIGQCTGSCLAATFIGYYSCSPSFSDNHCKIQDSDVEGRVNTADANGGPYYSNGEACTAGAEYGVEGIWVHEAGHQLGLGHSSVNGSTMYPSVSSCNQGPASVASDDCRGTNKLYKTLH